MENKPIKGANMKLDTVVQLEQKNIKLQRRIDTLENKVLELKHQKLERERQIFTLRQSEPKPEGGDISIHVIPPKPLSSKNDK